jgi:hypothetical protein
MLPCEDGKKPGFLTGDPSGDSPQSLVPGAATGTPTYKTWAERKRATGLRATLFALTRGGTAALERADLRLPADRPAACFAVAGVTLLLASLIPVVVTRAAMTRAGANLVVATRAAPRLPTPNRAVVIRAATILAEATLAVLLVTVMSVGMKMSTI